MSYNKVILIGNLTRDPELRYTPQGVAVSTMRIAVNTRIKDKTGGIKTETAFLNVIVWDKQAELCNQYLQKGRKVLVEGRLQQRSWQNQAGQNMSTIEVRADRVVFLDRKPKEEKEEIDLGPLPEELEEISEEEIS